MTSWSAPKLSGLTLVEVLIAVAVLGVGILALAQLQVFSLQNSGRAGVLRTVTQIAEAELEWQRQLRFADVESFEVLGEDCSTFRPAGFGCELDIVGCSPVGDGVTCAAGLSNPIAYQITVRAFSDSRPVEFEQSVTTTGQRYIAGVRSSGEIVDPPPNGSAGGGEDNGDDDEDDDTGAPIVTPGPPPGVPGGPPPGRGGR